VNRWWRGVGSEMPRPYFPHTLGDVTRAVDGPLGLVVGDMPDGTIWVLNRDRKGSGYTLTHYVDGARSALLEKRDIAARAEAVNAMADAIGLGERL
jgi:hypothetical protein